MSEISERADKLIFELERLAEVSTSNNPNQWRIETRKKLRTYIASLESQLTIAKRAKETLQAGKECSDITARLTAYETGFDPETNKPMHYSDVEDEIVIFKDKMGRPYLGIYDTDDNKWQCISATPFAFPFAFETETIERWYPLPGRWGE
jgi:hypothetical protein